MTNKYFTKYISENYRIKVSPEKKVDTEDSIKESVRKRLEKEFETSQYNDILS